MQFGHCCGATMGVKVMRALEGSLNTTGTVTELPELRVVLASKIWTAGAPEIVAALLVRVTPGVRPARTARIGPVIVSVLLLTTVTVPLYVLVTRLNSSPLAVTGNVELTAIESGTVATCESTPLVP